MKDILKDSSLSALIIFILLISGCKKKDINTIEDPQLILYNQIESYLLAQKIKTSIYNGHKIDSLLGNIEKEKIQKIKIGGITLLVCDLKGYKNVSKNEYTNTFYKMSFPLDKEVIASGLIYTIHTNLVKNDIDINIEKILLIEYDGFTGEIITNGLDDRFIQGFEVNRGQLKKSYELQNHSKDENSQISSRSLNEDCTSYFLVTTTYYSNGDIERTSQYLYTLCGPCNTAGQPVNYFVNDCDPNMGSGGDENVVTTDSVSETAEVEDESSGLAPKIKYLYYATVSRFNGIVTNVIIDPTTVWNPFVSYVDNYGSLTNRYITLFGHTNIWVSLGTKALIKWSCIVHGKWVYSDARPVYTRQWTNSKQSAY